MQALATSCLEEGTMTLQAAMSKMEIVAQMRGSKSDGKKGSQDSGVPALSAQHVRTGVAAAVAAVAGMEEASVGRARAAGARGWITPTRSASTATTLGMLQTAASSRASAAAAWGTPCSSAPTRRRLVVDLVGTAACLPGKQPTPCVQPTA